MGQELMGHLLFEMQLSERVMTTQTASVQRSCPHIKAITTPAICLLIIM